MVIHTYHHPNCTKKFNSEKGVKFYVTFECNFRFNFYVCNDAASEIWMELNFKILKVLPLPPTFLEEIKTTSKHTFQHPKYYKITLKFIGDGLQILLDIFPPYSLSWVCFLCWGAVLCIQTQNVVFHLPPSYFALSYWNFK